MYIGCLVPGRMKVKKYLFSGNRSQVRAKSAEAALKLLIRCLREQERAER